MPVKKVHVVVTSALPARSLAPAIMTVKVVLDANGLVGVNVAILSRTSYETFPTTTVAPGPVTVKVTGLIVEGSIALSKVALTEASVPTLPARFAGFLRMTVGGVVSVLSPVVKVQTKLLASVLPARSAT